MKKVFHKAKDRGFFNFDWLQGAYSFSFANWYNPEKMNFGALRVLNDDIITADNGFGMHPHENMEIVTILLSGSLAHKDSLGSQGVIKSGQIQAMSAGTGILHSEFNPSKTEETKSLQIWIMPKKYNIEPRYQQKDINFLEAKNQWITLVSGDKNNQNSLWINQDANFKIVNLEKGKSVNYSLEYGQNSGVYFFLIKGKVKVDKQELNLKDAIGVWNFTEKLEIIAFEESQLLAIEVPMD
jgi:quercetin 2,3-dioxygenase